MTLLNTESFSFDTNREILIKFEKSYLKSNLPHSIIIYGEKGIGKSTFVKYFVNKLFNNFSEKNNILDTKHATLINNNSHPNFLVISKLFDEKKNKIKNDITVDQIRNLESFIYQTSLFDLPKIILIDVADDLNIDASNSLLKILEEPRKNTYFFLISNQLSHLPSTIRSRCIKFKFNKPTYNEFTKIILSNSENNIEKSKIDYLYDLSNGCPGIALQHSLEDITDYYDEFIDILKNIKILNNDILNFSSKLSKFNNDQYSSFLFIVKFTLLNVIKINLCINKKNKLGEKINNNFEIISTKINFSNCYNALNYLEKNENNLYVFNLDKKLFTLNLFSEIAID